MRVLAIGALLYIMPVQLSAPDNIALCRALAENQPMPKADDNVQAREKIDFTTLDCEYWLEIDKIRRETGYVGWDSLPVPQRDPF